LMRFASIMRDLTHVRRRLLPVNSRACGAPSSDRLD
jgi:hypothetical protein